MSRNTIKIGVDNATYRSPKDFTVAYTSKNTLTVTGAPFTVGDSECYVLFILVLRADGEMTDMYQNGIEGITITSDADVITLKDNRGTTEFFGSNDVAYYVGISQQDKGYNPLSGSYKTTLVDSLGAEVSLGGGASPDAEYKSPTDFTATVAGAGSTVTLTGLPITIVDDSQIKYVYVVHTLTNISAIYTAGEEYSFKYNAGTGVLTVYKDGVAYAAAFALGDVVEVGLAGQVKSYDPTLDVTKVIEQSPIWSRYTDAEAIVTNQTVSTFGSYVDAGAVIDMRGYTVLNVYINLDINQATNFKLRALGQTTVTGGATDEFALVIETVSATDIKVDKQYIEFNTDADQLVILSIETNGIPYVQLQVDGGTDGGTDPILTSVKINKIWR